MLEILLASLLAIAGHRLFKARRRERVLRHVFASHAEWCRHHIADVRASAIDNVVTEVALRRQDESKSAYEWEDCIGAVRNDILDANEALSAQQRKVQSILVKHRIPPLDWSDYDATVFDPKLQRVLDT